MSNIYDYENKIASLVQSQFPSFYESEGQGFIDFVKAYYTWLEVTNNPINMARSLLSYRDVDTTPDAFLLFFKNKYLNNIQFTTASNKRLFIKNSLDFYRAKGTPRAVDLFFRLIYGVNADVYLPGEDVFRLSDGQWVKPTYLEVTHTERNLDCVGQTITGLASGATAFVDRLVRRRINSKYIDIFYISAITGDFLTNESLSIDTDLTGIPVVIGSLTTADVIDGSNAFSIGDTIIITSTNGLQAKASVTGVTNTTGQVDFSLVDGGWGYTVNAEIIISNSVITYTNATNTFLQFEKVNQPLANIVYGSLAGGTFANGNVIEKYAANGTVMGTGTIISTTATNSTAGSLLAQVGVLSNGSISNLNYTSAFAKQGNAVTATTTTFTDKTASANVVGSNATAVGISNVGNTFYATSNAYVYGLTSNNFANITAIANGSSANVKFTNLVYSETIYLNNDLIGANNSGLVPFLNIILNGSNSNVASNGYGFAKKPSANINSRIFDALTYTPMTVGVIGNLTNVNPGNAYSVKPFITAYEKYYAGLYKLYYTVDLTNPTRSYSLGETVEQTITVSNSVTLTVNNSASTWQVGEFVYQSNGTSNIATGILQAQTISSNVGNLVIFSVSGAFVTNSTARINGLTSTAGANISAVNTTSYFANAKAIVQSQTGDSLSLKRISTLDLSTSGANLVGISSGATATVASITPQSPPQSGLNANIAANVTTANGTVANVVVYDSGFGYVNGEIATFTSEDGSRSGTLELTLAKQGQSEGYYKSTKGFISNDKYLFDGDYYQEYSYEVRSPLAFETYTDVLNKVLHLAGTKPFGQVILSSVTNSFINAVSYTSNISTANVVFTLTSSSNQASQIPLGSVVYQSNGTANIAFGTVTDPIFSVITIGTPSLNFVLGEHLFQPNTLTNTFGYVQSTTTNSTATTLYVSNCSMTFNASANVYGLRGFDITYTPRIIMKLNSVTNPSNTSQSFEIGENVYQGTVGSQTANGTVQNANSSTIEITLNTGTFANSTTLHGQTSNCSATLLSYSNNTFTVGENTYIDQTILFMSMSANAKSAFENNTGLKVFQQKRNPNTSTISFVNTAVGILFAVNSTSLIVSETFGNFTNNAYIELETLPEANGTVVSVLPLQSYYGTVAATNSTVVTLSPTNISQSDAGKILKANTSNTRVSMGSVGENFAFYAVTSVINTMRVQTVNGFFVANSTVNAISTTNTSPIYTATLSGVDYVQL